MYTLQLLYGIGNPSYETVTQDDSEEPEFFATIEDAVTLGEQSNRAYCVRDGEDGPVVANSDNGDTRCIPGDRIEEAAKIAVNIMRMRGEANHRNAIDNGYEMPAPAKERPEPELWRDRSHY